MNMNIEKIEKMKRNKKGKDCVFLIPFFLGEKVYKDYTEVDNSLRNKEIPLILAQIRWNGKLGFVGGKVEPNETLVEGLIREVKEESGMRITGEDIIPICSHRHKGNHLNLHLHCFAYECKSIDELKNISANSHSAEHFMVESGGLVPIQIADFSYKNLLKNNWESPSDLELIEFVNKFINFK